MTSSSPCPSPWWQPRIHADRRPLLLTRNRIQAALRAHFSTRDFVEVEAACLQVSPGNEAHLSAFATEAIRHDGLRETLYLHTSPEFACKKLLAAGETKILSIAKVFRNRERGPLHHPEFTMVEWYRANEGYAALMRDCAEVLGLAAETAGVPRLTYRGREADPFAPFERLSVAEAFARHAGIDLLATMARDGGTDRDALASAIAARGLRVAEDDTWADLYSRILVGLIEPHLGDGRPTLLCEYPVSEAALARPSPSDPRVAERFELYACGVELANAFGELTNPAEQRRRFEAEMDEKARVYGERYPIDEDFLDALAIMPEASGIALGFDRLVMLATGAPRIDDVVWTPVARGSDA
ncbi:EF-P lysine aminoacylase EpmA [Methylobacterium thuringiense]|uniref:Elongation factor P--(R)-beta-lysine ligase n=1 Tax=Methylobacterium thuringiense TaxID=1003091 RepID=A0ABQ4TN13_9HYPH|nr:EF-P lysine aminoacylase EpmA [Methylobacterium thuringiense]GJE55492.1 Elongation factor P--(R)-beta-lysine ligase [Methylobacterium thuringiense]